MRPDQIGREVRSHPGRFINHEMAVLERFDTIGERAITHPELRPILAAASGHLCFITNNNGAPYTSGSFAMWFKKACRAAGLNHCSAHGLRHAAARRLADAGATPHEIAAITGHRSLAEVARYTAAADQKRLAAAAMSKVKK